MGWVVGGVQTSYLVTPTWVEVGLDWIELKLGWMLGLVVTIIAQVITNNIAYIKGVQQNLEF